MMALALLAAILACTLGWFAIASMLHYIGTMPSRQVLLAVAIGAALPYVRDLVALVPSLPPALASAITAVVLAVAYKIVPKDGAK